MIDRDLGPLQAMANRLARLPHTPRISSGTKRFLCDLYHSHMQVPDQTDGIELLSPIVAAISTFVPGSKEPLSRKLSPAHVLSGDLWTYFLGRRCTGERAQRHTTESAQLAILDNH